VSKLQDTQIFMDYYMKTRCKQVMITKNTTVCHMIIGARNSFDTAWGEAVSNLALFFRLAGGIAKQCAVRQQNPDGRALPRRHPGSSRRTCRRQPRAAQYVDRAFYVVRQKRQREFPGNVAQPLGQTVPGVHRPLHRSEGVFHYRLGGARVSVMKNRGH